MANPKKPQHLIYPFNIHKNTHLHIKKVHFPDKHNNMYIHISNFNHMGIISQTTINAKQAQHKSRTSALVFRHSCIAKRINDAHMDMHIYEYYSIYVFVCLYAKPIKNTLSRNTPKTHITPLSSNVAQIENDYVIEFSCVTTNYNPAYKLQHTKAYHSQYMCVSICVVSRLDSHAWFGIRCLFLPHRESISHTHEHLCIYIYI